MAIIAKQEVHELETGLVKRPMPTGRVELLRDGVPIGNLVRKTYANLSDEHQPSQDDINAAWRHVEGVAEVIPRDCVAKYKHFKAPSVFGDQLIWSHFLEVHLMWA